MLRILLLVLGVLISFCYLFFFYKSSDDFVIKVYPGFSYSQALTTVSNNKKLRLLKLFAKFSKLSSSYNKKYCPKIGSYKIGAGCTPFGIFRKLYRGEQDPILLVIKEGVVDLQELSKFFASVFLCSYEEFFGVFSDEKFLDSLKLSIDTALTIFIPNTYNVYWTVSPMELFRRMVREQSVFWNDGRCAKARSLKLSPSSIYILASIVYRETCHKAEVCAIAGVYINRLQKGIHLGACPTLLYILREKISRLRFRDTKVVSKYNTYTHYGLPPGPICVPSIRYIDEVLNYSEATHDFLYFCSKADFSGWHCFSKSFAEHKCNAVKYQRFLSSKKILR